LRTSYLAAAATGDLRPVPGEPGPPVIGHTVRLMRDPLGWSRYFYDRYGPVAWTNLFGIRIVSAAGCRPAPRSAHIQCSKGSLSTWPQHVQACRP